MDYKHRVPGNRSRKPRRPDRTGLVAGVLVAATTLAVAAWLLSSDDGAPPVSGQAATPSPEPVKQPQETAPARAQKRDDKGAPASPTPGAAPKAAEPRFSFYKILPEKEVIIAESEIKTLKREESLGKKSDGSRYLLQAGSFTRLEDAEALRSRLSQLKVKAKIENVRIDNADWHRVKVGPFDSLVNADKVRVYLRANKVDSVVQKSTQD